MASPGHEPRGHRPRAIVTGLDAPAARLVGVARHERPRPSADVARRDHAHELARPRARPPEILTIPTVHHATSAGREAKKIFSAHALALLLPIGYNTDMNTAAHKQTAATLGLDWSIVRAIYGEMRELETMAVARTLEARRIAYAALGHKHGGTFKMANRHATTIGDATNVRHFDDVARELAATELPELGHDDPAAALWDLVTAPAPVLATADETMVRAIDRAAAEPATSSPAASLADMIALPEAAGLADVTEQWLRQLVKAGRVAGVKVGRNYLVSRSAAENFRRHPSMGRPRLTPF
jgi:hypothetical protein